jgi:anti-sigma regulatory factor (Ser/Thr protein kinase)
MLRDEEGRLAALRRYRILDTEPERAFDDLTLLASHICGTPIALITLLDADRQWIKSRVGLDAQETSRSVAFCHHAIAHPDLFEVRDARGDERFRANPFVTGAPGIRFYAGAPLVISEGYALGTLCVLDTVPRVLTGDQRAALEALRRQAVAQLELRRNLDDLAAVLHARDEAEAGQARLVGELRGALDNVQHLSALLPFCDTCRLDMVIPARADAISAVTQGVMRVLRERAWPEAEEHAVELALQEALANAVRHGCGGDDSKRVQCCVACSAAGEVTIVVRDPGPGFDPEAVPNPLEGENVFRGSGRGVFLINQLMDEVRYADRGREVLMRKSRKTG